MAERKAVVATPTDNVLVITWSGLLNTDNGEPVMLPHYPDKSWHVTGTAGTGGVARPKGHNRNVSGGTVDLTNDPILANVQDVDIPGTPNAIEEILENPLFIYPHVTAGDGATNLEARLVCKR